MWVGSGMPTSTLSPDMDLKASRVYKHGIAGDSEVITIPCDVRGSIVSVYQPSDSWINICEVEVYGVYRYVKQ